MAPDRNFRRSGWRALADSVAPLTASFAGKRGFTTARLQADWPLIVGTRLAARSQPQRIARPAAGETGGTLVVRIAAGPLAVELQHQAPLILERINTFFGWRIASRLRLVHGPLPAPPAPPPAPPSPADPAVIEAAVTGIEDPLLAAALRALAARVLARREEREEEE